MAPFLAPFLQSFVNPWQNGGRRWHPWLVGHHAKAVLRSYALGLFADRAGCIHDGVEREAKIEATSQTEVTGSRVSTKQLRQPRQLGVEWTRAS